CGIVCRPTRRNGWRICHWACSLRRVNPCAALACRAGPDYAVAAQPTVLLSPGSIRSRCASPHDTRAGYSGGGREGGTVARDRERGDAGTDLLPNVGPQSARNCARLVRPGVGSTCSMKLPRLQCEHMPWQEVPEIVGNCRVFGRIMYCGEKCWI